MIFRVLVLILVLSALFCLPVFAQLEPGLDSLSIVINLPSRTLELYARGSLAKTYPLAVGKPSTPTPLGNFHIFHKEVDPWWYPPRTGKAIPSGPDNPLGYRWMEFAPMYGIHGTNAPWAIGLAVSNGCIRMHEADVEELFAAVSYGTPVRVTYDRVKVRTNANGEVSIGIYPDIYGWQSLSPQDIRSSLQASGVGDFLSDEDIVRLIEEEADRQVVVARIHGIRVNGSNLAAKAITYKDVMYVPVVPVANALGAVIGFDDSAGLVRFNNQSVPSIPVGGQKFVTADGARILLGGQQVWDPEDNHVSFDALAVLFNGRPVTGDVRTIDGVLAVPLASVAEASGQKPVRTDGGEYLVRGVKVPARIIGDTPYIQITQIYDIFQAYVFWNQAARTIELTYPFNPAPAK